MADTLTQLGVGGGPSSVGAKRLVVRPVFPSFDPPRLSIHSVSIIDNPYQLGTSHTRGVPKLRDDTIVTHRKAVHDSIMQATAALVAKHGITGVTMSQIADDAGIGRATLCKYFPDVEAVLKAWHERHVAEHLARLEKTGAQVGRPSERLEAVLGEFAHIAYERHGSDLAALLHRGEQVVRAHNQIQGFIRDLVAEGAAQGDFRRDVAPDELASYCLHALSAASSLASKAAVRRLVEVTMSGLRPTRPQRQC